MRETGWLARRLTWAALALVVASWALLSLRRPVEQDGRPRSRSYVVGQWTITAQTPVLVAESASAGSPTAFPSLMDWFGRAIMLRYSQSPDTDNLAATGRIAVSYDRGATWPASARHTIYRSQFVSNEALTLIADSNQFGAQYQRQPGRVAQPGMAVGGEYICTVQAGVRSLKCRLMQFLDGGLDYSSQDLSFTITGFPADITSAKGYLNTEIVQISRVQWLALVQVGVGGAAPLPFSCYAIESTDQGKTWAVVGTVAAGASVTGAEGYSEPSLFRMSSGKLIVVSRTGTVSNSNRIYRVSSTDVGRTWTANPNADRIQPFTASPRLVQLANGDYMILCGRRTASADSAGPRLGLWLDSDVEAGDFSDALDLVTVHNELISDPSYQYDTGLSPHVGATGYMGFAHLGGNDYLIAYDRAAGQSGYDSTKNLVWVIRLTIART